MGWKRLGSAGKLADLDVLFEREFLFDLHVAEFALFEDVAAELALDVFGLIVTGDDANTRVLARFFADGGGSGGGFGEGGRDRWWFHSPG